VGAYGQEVAETIDRVVAIDRQTGEETVFPREACAFTYRHSRFKQRDRDRYIITSVSFRLENDALPSLRYPELRKRVEEINPALPGRRGSDGLVAVREIVLALRRSKAMIIDPSDPETRSVGSFFLNPLVTREDLQRILAVHVASGETGEVPHFPAGEHEKVPAAWLVEHAGFRRGYTEGGVGISARHALALVNRGGTTHELLGLATRIEEAVRRKFGVTLEREPVLLR
jgi:UDP-N-acetylmuramate dehydrogenase